MHQGKLVFAQLMLYLPLGTFRRCVADHNGQHKVKDFSCLDQFFAMAFAQLTFVVFLSAAGRARAVNSSKGDSNNVGTVG